MRLGTGKAGRSEMNLEARLSIPSERRKLRATHDWFCCGVCDRKQRPHQCVGPGVRKPKN